MTTFPIRLHRRALVCLTMLLLASPLTAGEAPLTLTIQPIQSREKTRAFYRPLADYLAQRLGREVRLDPAINFLTYWQRLRKGHHDIALEAAHFADYRRTKLGYELLAKMPGTVTYSLVTSPDTLFFEADELVGKKVATAAPPSLGALRLQQLFPSPLRQPVLIETANMDEAFALINSDRVVAAIVPTPLLNAHPHLNVVLTTDPAPHVTFSASPKLPKSLRERLRHILLDMHKDPEGRKVLEAIGFRPLEAPNPKDYDGYERLLRQTWGY